MRVLYLCYLSLEDPLVDTQVVAYLRGLVKLGHTVHLLTFEPRRLSRGDRDALRDRLAERGIAWHSLRYHKRPSLLATALDVASGIIAAGMIVRRHRLRAIHARSHVPAAMALGLKRVAGVPFIFDIRGLMGEEYVDAGRWRRGGVAFRITKAVERAAINRASATVVLTERVSELLFGGRGRPGVHVIPCCADVERIALQRRDRERARGRLGWQDRRVLIYVGKFTGWYMEQEMVEFFVEARRLDPDLHFHVVTQHDRAPVIAEFQRHGIPADAYSIARVAPERVGEHLAAADAAISFIRRCPSKVSSSPTKIGEYLAAGLPVVSSSGIGDVDDLFADDRIGILLDVFDQPHYRRAAERLRGLMADEDARTRRMQLASERLSVRRVGVPAYDAVYREVARSAA